MAVEYAFNVSTGSGTPSFALILPEKAEDFRVVSSRGFDEGMEAAVKELHKMLDSPYSKDSLVAALSGSYSYFLPWKEADGKVDEVTKAVQAYLFNMRIGSTARADEAGMVSNSIARTPWPAPVEGEPNIQSVSTLPMDAVVAHLQRAGLLDRYSTPGMGFIDPGDTEEPPSESAPEMTPEPLPEQVVQPTPKPTPEPLPEPVEETAADE